MHVGLVIYGDLSTVSGGYLYDRKLVQYLREAGDTIDVISLPWRNYARHLGDNFAPALQERLSALQVDVLLQDELNHPSLAWLNPRLRQEAAYPIVAIVHHLRCSERRNAGINWLYQWVEKRYLKSVDGLIFNSQTTRQVVSGQGIDLEATPNLVAYPSGDHLEAAIQDLEIAHRSATDGPLRLIFLGNLIPRKGLHTLLEAISQLPVDTCNLAVVGSPMVDPAYTHAIQVQIEDLNLGSQVQLYGPLERQRLEALLRASHVLAVPSSYEGFGIVYLEGMAYGLPAIATTDGATWETITEAENGYLVPPGDTDILASRIHEFAADRARLLQFSLAARQRYLAHPTWSQSVGKIHTFLHDLVGRVQ